jgi:CBS domain-containing protein
LHSQLVSLGPDEPLSRAVKLIAEEGSDVLVMESGRPLGVVRGIDVVRATANGKKADGARLRDVMLTPAPLVRAGASIDDVVRLANRVGVKAVYVSERGAITGRVELEELVALMASSWNNLDAHKALSTRARLRIAELLSTNPMSVGQIAKATGMKPVTVRHHLKVLRIGGLVVTEEIRGKVGRPTTVFRGIHLVRGKP